MDEFPSFERNTRTPNPLPPPRSCDAQIHVFGDPERYPGRAGRLYDPPRASFEDSKQVHRALGIERVVIAQATPYGTDHRLLLDALRGQKNCKGVAIIDDTVSDEELHALHDAGVRGARFNFAKFLNYAPDPESFRRSIARIQPLGWFAKVHGSAVELLENEHLLRPLTLPVLMDHLGGVDFSRDFTQSGCALILDLLKNHGWWMMISNGDRWSKQGPPWDDVIPFAQAFVEAAPDRTVWGTDWPHVRYRPKMPNDADLLELLYRAVPDPAQRHRILVDNPARLFDFET